MENSDLPQPGKKRKRANVYTGYCRQNNYIQCLSSGKKPGLHNRLGKGRNQERNAPVTQHLCNGGAV